MIEDAYSVLGNPIKRKKYDDTLGENYKKTIEKPAPPMEKSPMWEGRTQSRKILKLLPMGNLARRFIATMEINPEFELKSQIKKYLMAASFQKVRVYKNVTLDQISKSTRIGRQYLVAVEPMISFTSCPGFVRGFISQFGKNI